MLHPDLARELAQQRQAQLLDAADRWRTAERVRVMPSSRAEDVQPVWRFTALVAKVTTATLAYPRSGGRAGQTGLS